MRIALVITTQNTSSKFKAMTLALKKGMEAGGHRVDILDAQKDDGMRLGGYEYITVFAAKLSPLSSKIPKSLQKILGTCSSLQGKRSAAFLPKQGLFTSKAMYHLMDTMETEGMRVTWSEFLTSVDQAEATGARVG